MILPPRDPNPRIHPRDARAIPPTLRPRLEAVQLLHYRHDDLDHFRRVGLTVCEEVRDVAGDLARRACGCGELAGCRAGKGGCGDGADESYWARDCVNLLAACASGGWGRGGIEGIHCIAAEPARRQKFA